MPKIKLIRGFESISFSLVTPDKNNKNRPGKFASDIELLLSKGWKLVSNGSTFRHEGCVIIIYSWAYIENTTGEVGMKVFRDLGYTDN